MKPRPSWDMKKAYEMIEFRHLIEEAEALNYPMVMMRIHIAMYSATGSSV